MAEYKSIITIRGRIGDLQFYQSQGRKLIRQATSITREQILSSPGFTRTRENMAEFGGASTAAKALRLCIGQLGCTFGDSTLSARATQAMRSVIGAGDGPRGRRPVSISACRHLLAGFEWHTRSPFTSAFLGDFSVSVAPSRCSASITFPDFTPELALLPPAGATHVRFAMAIGVLQDHHFDLALQAYRPADPLADPLFAVAFSPFMQLTLPFLPAFTLSASLPIVTSLPAHTSLLVATGVEWFDRVGAEHYPLAEGRALRVHSLH